MNKLSFTMLTAILLFSLFSCQKEKTGTLIFSTVFSTTEMKAQPMVESNCSEEERWVTDNIKGLIYEIWVSQEVVQAGNQDNMQWYKIGENNELKFWNEYTFTAENLPAGEYKSIKIRLGHNFYRYMHLLSDPEVTMVNLEANDSWDAPCDSTAIVPINYFSEYGNHNYSQEDSMFYLVSEGEKLGGFTINQGGVTKLYMKMNGYGGDGIDPCTSVWIDTNNNGVWDCGIDRLDDFQCPPEITTMADFIVEYE